MQNRLFSHVKRLLGGNRATAFDDLRSYRLSVYTAELDKPEHTFPDDEADRIDIHAFGRDFASGDATDEGYVLLTDGMSNRRMDVSVSDSDEAVKRRAELMWYVREPTQEILANFRWLAKLPFIDSTWFGFEHRIQMPEPPLKDCDFRTFLFLTPIVRPDERVADALVIEGDPVEILTVNLISDAEYAFIKENGLSPFLDLMDENGYPLIFDPKRESYV